ncbi:MAG: DUF6508 domain-containing protein [Syntrophomonadaceae bacterium]
MEGMRIKSGLHMLEKIVNHHEFFLQHCNVLVTSSGDKRKTEYHPGVEEFIEAVYDSGFFLHYDWMPWEGWAERYEKVPDLYRQASLLDIRKILSGCIRKERISSGALAALIRSGQIKAMMERLEEILEDFLAGKQPWQITVCGPLPLKNGKVRLAYISNSWSYWADPVRVLAGAYPGDLNPRTAWNKLGYLLQSGIGLVINLMEPHERNHQGIPFFPYEGELYALAASMGRDIQLKRFDIPDMSVPAEGSMRQILDCIDAALARDRSVYVHCWGGHGRTGTVVGCYLARRGMAAGREAVDLVERLHSSLHNSRAYPSLQDPRQVDMIHRWKVGQ